MFENLSVKLILSLLTAVATAIFKQFLENDLFFAVCSGILLFMMLAAYTYIENKKKGDNK